MQSKKSLVCSGFGTNQKGIEMGLALRQGPIGPALCTKSGGFERVSEDPVLFFETGWFVK